MIDRHQRPDVLRFGTFELDLSSSEVRKRGALVKLQSQHFQLLALLAGRAGQVVSREEIRRALWDSETFVDFDRSINFSVNQIRAALDDDPQCPRFIETIPRKGYRFIAPVTRSDDEEVPRTAPQLVPANPWFLVGAAALAVVVLAALAVLWRDRLLAQPRAKPIESLAVLPLENLSRDAEQEYFADGMTDELITDLAKISALRVVSRTSVMRYKGTRKTVAEIARELNVDAVLEGTVTRNGERVRITAQLIQAEPEKHLWAEKYEANFGEVLSVQDAVAKAVAREIRVTLSPRDEKRLEAHAITPEAHDAYLKGRYFWAQSGEGNLTKSRDYFERAINEEPGYAAAWAGLASTYNRLASWGVMARAASSPKAKAAAERAMELDESLAEPFVALAEVKSNYEWDWAGAERMYRKAINLSPGDGNAHGVYATYLAAAGRLQEAVVEARSARDAEPLSGVYEANLVWELYAARKYEEAETENRKLIAWDERSADSYITASLYLATGGQREAVDMLRKGAAGPNPGLIELMFLGHALGATGARAEGKKVLNKLLELRQQRNVPSQYIALVFEGLGERAKALEWFEKAYSERSMNIWFLPDPKLDGIRKEQRYHEIMRGMGIEQ